MNHEIHRVAFRVDASIQIGTGHVMRCLTLADELKTRGAQCLFICRGHDGNIIQTIEARQHQVVVLPEPTSQITSKKAKSVRALKHATWLQGTWQQDAEDCIENIRPFKPDLLVVDHYALDIEWESQLRPHVGRILVIDDLADRTHDCDFLLDQNWFDDTTKFRYNHLLPARCKTLLGPEFALLKPEYKTLHSICTPRDGTLKRILVFMGGSDSANQTSRVLKALSAPYFNEIALDVVIGQNHPARGQVETLIAQREGPTRLHGALPTLAELMIRADLMIGAGGSTTWERLCLGLPCLTISVADNQFYFNDSLAKAGVIAFLGSHLAFEDHEIAKQIEEFIKNPKQLNIMSRKALTFVDGLGASRVIEALNTFDHKPSAAIDRDITLRRAQFEDAKLLFDWRNHPLIREKSRNTAPLNYESHLTWFKKSLEDESKIILVACDKSAPVGCVRFDKEESTAEVSIYLDPNNLGQGLGVPVLDTALKWLKSACPEIATVSAEVLGGNLASHKLFLRCGFSLKRELFELKLTDTQPSNLH